MKVNLSGFEIMTWAFYRLYFKSFVNCRILQSDLSQVDWKASG